MRSIRVGSFLAAAGVVLAVAGPAAAERPTCEDLLSARQLGRSADQVASAFRTTRIRVTACERLAQQHERLAAQREHVRAARAARIAR
jgi:hypothetical protein